MEKTLEKIEDMRVIRATRSFENGKLNNVRIYGTDGISLDWYSNWNKDGKDHCSINLEIRDNVYAQDNDLTEKYEDKVATDIKAKYPTLFEDTVYSLAVPTIDYDQRNVYSAKFKQLLVDFGMINKRIQCVFSEYVTLPFSKKPNNKHKLTFFVSTYGDVCFSNKLYPRTGRKIENYKEQFSKLIRVIEVI